MKIIIDNSKQVNNSLSNFTNSFRESLKVSENQIQTAISELGKPDNSKDANKLKKLKTELANLKTYASMPLPIRDLSHFYNASLSANGKNASIHKFVGSVCDYLKAQILFAELGYTLTRDETKAPKTTKETVKA